MELSRRGKNGILRKEHEGIIEKKEEWMDLDKENPSFWEQFVFKIWETESKK